MASPHVYALAGRREEAQNGLNQLLEMSKRRYVSPTLIAMVYIALNEKDKAFAWLDEGEKAHDLYIMIGPVSQPGPARQSFTL